MKFKLILLIKIDDNLRKVELRCVRQKNLTKLCLVNIFLQ